ncbi:hypothetical protein HHK36_010834 [Tetracentron sinense]|uniref:Serine aminopeptidase S33 domain-containing protein n=1 Tax=Tetracentron sinense TaxID=13715 RepID=A0A834Z713_TETSI|nr:hypothetical protein HHK36_010834 [Tetracentron sinense]
MVEGECPAKDYQDPPPAPLVDAQELAKWSFYRALIAEFIATLLFLYITVLTVIGYKSQTDPLKNPDDQCGGVGILGIAWAFGGMIFVLVYCTAGISGGHINPAVTFGLFLARKVSLIRAVLYMVAQCLGAICGVGLVKAFQNSYYDRYGGGANELAAGYSKGVGLAAEIIGTFVLVYTVFSATDPKRSARDSHIPVLAPLPIGFAVFMVHLATIPITGTGINPARSFGAAVIYNKEKAWDDQVVDILGWTIHRCRHCSVLPPGERSKPFRLLTPTEFYARHSVCHSSDYITNARALKLFTQSWTPLPLTTIIAIVHGFTGESSWFVQLTAVHLAKSGFATCAIDHQGHGFSDGLVAHIPDINPVVDDCVTFFDSFRAKHPPSLPSFLYAESLDGAISLLIHLWRGPSRPWDRLVLNGAMRGISAKFKPPWPLEHFLSLVAAVVPTWQVVPTRGSLPNLSFKEEWKRRLAIASPRRSMARPRAATALELLRVSREVQGRFEEVDVPLLIVHGGDDLVCDPAGVEELYRRAASKDKTIRVYPGMWHQLVGEPEENVELVFGEIVDWLRTRVELATAAGEGGGLRTRES